MGTILKVVALVLATILVVMAGYMIVNSVIRLFNGRTVGEAIGDSWYNITHLFGLIKDKAENEIGVITYPMTNANITWDTHVTARSW